MKGFLTGNTACRESCLAGRDQSFNKRQTAPMLESKALWMRSFALAAVFILISFIFAFAAENTVSAPPLHPRAPEMSAAGKVLEISDKTLKIERTLKGEVEIMEFVLEKPYPHIVVGDQIKVSYLKKEGQNILIRVAPAKKTAVRKAGKKDPPKELKPAASPAVPATK